MNDDTTTDDTAETMTPKELANELGTDPKTVRKFLRSLSSERPGKGGRWAISTADLDAIKTRFENWNSTKATVFSIDEVDDTDAEG